MPCGLRQSNKLCLDSAAKVTGEEVLNRRIPKIRLWGSRSTPRAKPASDKLFGKFDDLARLIVGFILTGVVGTYLSHRYTTQQASLAASGKVFNEHSKLIGDRFFAQNRLAIYLRDSQSEDKAPDPAELNSRLSAYRTVLQEWNSARGFNREMIKLYFGDGHWNSERDIHYAFRMWGEALEAEIKKARSVDFSCLEKVRDDLLVEVNSFRVHMAHAMQEGAVGNDRIRASVKRKDRPATICINSTKAK